MIYVGIDPGAAGAVGFYDAKNGMGWGHHLDTRDGLALASRLSFQISNGEDLDVAVERVHSTPQMGVVSAFSFGQAFGAPCAVVDALLLPRVLVAPQTWMKLVFGGQPRPKDRRVRKAAILRLAQERFPGAGLKLVKDGAIADAIFMAYWLSKWEVRR